MRLSAEEAVGGIQTLLEELALTMEKFYVHLDLDSLDPSVGRANGYTTRGGFTSESLQALLAVIAKGVPVQALTVASYDPAYDTDGAVCRTAFEAISVLLGNLSAPASAGR